MGILAISETPPLNSSNKSTDEGCGSLKADLTNNRLTSNIYIVIAFITQNSNQTTGYKYSEPQKTSLS
jgi:hypothetical protein